MKRRYEPKQPQK